MGRDRFEVVFNFPICYNAVKIVCCFISLIGLKYYRYFLEMLEGADNDGE